MEESNVEKHDADPGASIPRPRKGIKGAWDNFIGPGATAAENGLFLGAASLGGVFQVVYGIFIDMGWTWWQWTLVLIMAIDIAGGVVANASNVLKRWYFRPGKTNKSRLGFVALHIYPLLDGLLFRNDGWVYGIILYVFLLTGASLVLLVPLYLKRPVSAFLILSGFYLGFWVFSPTKGLEWLFPALLLKLISGNLIPEEPYRPEGVF